MKLRSVLGLVVGSVVAAACSPASEGAAEPSGSPPPVATNADTTNAANGTTNATANNAATTDSVVASGPKIAEETCAQEGNYGGNWAVHAYPGKTAVDIANVVALCHLAEPAVVGGQSYTTMRLPVSLRDGAAAAACGPAGNPNCSSISFILP